MKARIFIKASPYIGNTFLHTKVSHWRWTRSKGLQVHYIDLPGYFKSQCTLRELLSKDKPEGDIKEVKP